MYRFLLKKSSPLTTKNGLGHLSDSTRCTTGIIVGGCFLNLRINEKSFVDLLELCNLSPKAVQELVTGGDI